jgi:prepilin-type N-terminal cleavage/methylation domain-containing protein
MRCEKFGLQRNGRGASGFTLIELLVVVAIIVSYDTQPRFEPSLCENAH